MITDYDSWHPGHGTVDITQIIETLHRNADAARAMIAAIARALSSDKPLCRAACDRALDHAIMTAPEARNPDSIRRLNAVAGRILNP